MKGFEFHAVGSFLSEVGGSARLGEIARKLGIGRIMLVTDPGIAGLGLPGAAEASLADAGIDLVSFTEVEADPSEATVLAAAARAREAGVDGVVGFGGGSSMDVAKLAAFLARSDQPLAEAWGVENARGARLPLIQMPTTAGTGSEMTPIAIVTTGATTKMGVVSSILYADWAILDAELTFGLPRHVTAATGVDAMVHALEAYTTRHRKNPVSDVLARRALSLLGGAIRRACDDGADAAARADMLLGSMLAGMAFANAPCAAVHALAYPIGGHFHVAHGLSNALVLPHVMRFNLPAAAAQYAEVAPLAMPALPETGDNLAGCLIEGFESLIDELGIENRLRQVGISHNHLPMLAEEAMKQQRLLVNNPREVAYDDALAIYERAF